MGPIPPPQRPAQPLWGSVGPAGWDSPQGGREAAGFVLLPSCCVWVGMWVQPTGECLLTAGSCGQGACSFQTRFSAFPGDAGCAQGFVNVLMPWSLQVLSCEGPWNGCRNTQGQQ